MDTDASTGAAMAGFAAAHANTPGDLAELLGKRDDDALWPADVG